MPGKYGPHGELLFFLIQKEPGSSPCAKLWKKEETVVDVTSLVWGTNGKWAARSPMWESEGEAWSEDENASSSGSREGNVCNDALHVIGLNGLGDKISLFLEDWELAMVALSWTCYARN